MATTYLPGEDHARLLLREVPALTVFTVADDRYLCRFFGRQPPSEIAYRIRHTETAVLYRARHLGLRRPARHWPAERVEAWLGLSPTEWPSLRLEGLDRFEIPNRAGDRCELLISATSLARWLVSGNRWMARVAGGADEFFVRDLLESSLSVQRNHTPWESCAFLSAGHVCMNPLASSSWGLFCTNSDKHAAGEDPKCAVRTVRIESLARRREGRSNNH